MMNILRGLASPKRRLMAAALSAVVVVLLLTIFMKQKDSKHTTSIVTWWGILDRTSKIRELETLCDTTLRVTDYINASELLTYAKHNPFDLYIYPWTYHQRMVPHFPQAGPKINGMVDDYHPAIREKYHQYTIPEDTVFFNHGMAMFVYDQLQIPDLNSLTVEDILELSRSKVGTVFLPDDMEHVNWLMNRVHTGTPENAWRELFRQVRSRRISNGVNIQNPGLDPSFKGLRLSHFIADYFREGVNPILGWIGSGEAMNPHHDWSKVKGPAEQPKNMRLGIHPSLSNVFTSLLALKSDDSRHQCVAQAMASRRFLRWYAESGLYFSPFEERIDSLPESAQQLTQEFYDNADSIPWIYDKKTDPIPNRPSAEAEMIWRLLRACEGGWGCEKWVAIGDKVFTGSS